MIHCTFLFMWLIEQSDSIVGWKDCESENKSHSVLSDPLQPYGLYVACQAPLSMILQARILKWVAVPSPRGSSQARDQTQVSHFAGGFFTSWATKEVQEHWSGYPIPSPEDLPDPGINPGSPALHADSLPTELSGKPTYRRKVFATTNALKGTTHQTPLWTTVTHYHKRKWQFSRNQT